MKRAEAAGYTDLWSGETNGPDGFTPLALSAAWTERARLGTGIVGVFQRGPALLAQEAAALADASGGPLRARHRLLLGPDRRRLERDPLREAAEPGARDARVPAHGARRRAHRERLQARDGAGASGCRSCSRRCAARCSTSRSSAADGAFTNFLPLGGLPKVAAQLEGAPEGFELLCRFFCIPGEREAVEPLARFMFSSYITVPVYAAFYRWLGYGEQIDAMVAAWEAGDRQARRGRGALGADRGHVHLRLAGGDEGAARRPSSRAASRCRSSPRSRRPTSSAS